MKIYPNYWLPIIGLCLINSCEPFEDLAYEPQVQTIPPEQAELIEAFSILTSGEASACNLIFAPGEITEVLCNIVIGAQPGSEIVFLVDKTSSMQDDIDEVKRNINEIIDCLPEQCRLGAGAYGDNRSDLLSWFTSTDLNDDYDVARDFINNITVVGGGDYPESVYDALYKILDEMSWRDCSAPDKIIVMGDAPPHTGFRTDYEAEDVIEKARSICPDTEFYPVIILDL